MIEHTLREVPSSRLGLTCYYVNLFGERVSLFNCMSKKACRIAGVDCNHVIDAEEIFHCDCYIVVIFSLFVNTLKNEKIYILAQVPTVRFFSFPLNLKFVTFFSILVKLEGKAIQIHKDFVS